MLRFHSNPPHITIQHIFPQSHHTILLLFIIVRAGEGGGGSCPKENSPIIPVVCEIFILIDRRIYIVLFILLAARPLEASTKGT